MNGRLLSLVAVIIWLPLAGAAVNDVQSRFEKALLEAKSLPTLELTTTDRARA